MNCSADQLDPMNSSSSKVNKINCRKIFLTTNADSNGNSNSSKERLGKGCYLSHMLMSSNYRNSPLRNIAIIKAALKVAFKAAFNQES